MIRSMNGIMKDGIERKQIAVLEWENGRMGEFI